MTTTAHPAAVAADLRERAEAHLRALVGEGARLRDDQWTAVEALAAHRRRVVVVQRTGWGKSAVYWVATALRRAEGAGPTLVISPLLALMRDQVAAAERSGLRAVAITSANVDDWPAIEAELAGGGVDVLLISPERLNSAGFRRRVLPHLAPRLGLLVVDEAHCISDWGHDFRPDYRRIAAVLAGLPEGTPVLATTATANARVSADVAGQLGDGTLTLRGPLDREGLALSVVPTPDVATAYAWVAEFLDGPASGPGGGAADGAPEGAGAGGQGAGGQAAGGQGIIYALTVAETARLAEFLASRGHAVKAYSSATEPPERERLEQDLLAGRLRALVATSSLGMGYDHPRLSFVVHLGAPSSPVAYYQHVGRAGRALDRAVGVVLPTAADERIWAYFDSTALPPEEVVQRVLRVLGDHGAPMTLPKLELEAGLRRGRLEALLKVLDVDGAVERAPGSGGGWVSTGVPWHFDAERIDGVQRARREEQQVMRGYLAGERCLMRTLREALDDGLGAARGDGADSDRRADSADDPGGPGGPGGPGRPGGESSTEAGPVVLASGVADCGRCSVCSGDLPAPGAGVSPEGVAAALAHLRSQTTVLEPRRMWPSGASRRGRIAESLRAEPGRALAMAEDPAWGEVVVSALRDGGAVPDEVLQGLVRHLSRWGWPAGRPSWVTWVPSRSHEPLLADLAHRIAGLGRMRVAPGVLTASPHGPRQSDTATSVAAADGALGRLEVPDAGAVADDPVLLLDDTSRSGWTLTVASALLRDAGSGPVYPLVLHKRV